ncbi:stage V sporulation protein AE [Syntrophomonas erecta]
MTDGDQSAHQAIECAARELKLFTLKATAGNPTPLNGREVLQLILQAPYEPVVVMVDDRGEKGIGPGERVIEYLMHCPEQIIVLGVVAVASDTRVKGIKVDRSVTAEGTLVKKRPVNKSGCVEPEGHYRLEGDTLEILYKYPDLLVVGCGDLGKMNGLDASHRGAAITKRCFQEILKGSESAGV